MLRTRSLIILGTIALLSSCTGREEEVSFTSPGGTATNFDDFPDVTLTEMSPISFQSGPTKVVLNDKQGSKESYLLILSSANTSPASYTVQLTDQSVASLTMPLQALEMEDSEDPEESLFHQYLREMEVVMAETEDLPKPSSKFMALTTEPKVGDETTFKVLASMTSLAQFKEVAASLKQISPNVFFYVDQEAEEEVNDKDIQELVSTFEAIIRPRVQSLFGSESDINGDGHITILMTCVLNTMSASGIVTGFFFPGDLYAASKTNAASNGQEIFYTLCPDPKAKHGPVPISASFAMKNLLPGVLAHEYQHMISFNRHVLENKGLTEEPWLNEGLSHLAEDLVGYGNENPSRVKLFLNQPNTTSLIPSTSPRLAERGAGYLFLRYLYEQHPDGDAFLQDLSDGAKTGVQNLVTAFNGKGKDFEFGGLLNQWATALILSETGKSADSRHNFWARKTDSQTGNLTGICLRCDAKDGRGTVLAGPVVTTVHQFPVTASLSSSASQFFLIEDAPAQIAINTAGSPTLTGSVLRLER